MSKPTALFSCTPTKNVKSSPASNKTNSARQTRNQDKHTVTESSPRRCRVQTEVQSSPSSLRGTNINIRSRFQITHMSPNMNQERRTTKPSPRKELYKEDNMEEKKKQTPASKQYTASGGVQLQNSRGGNATPFKRGFRDNNATSSDVPMNVNVKTMRSCFERKENKLPLKPPPSPSLPRQKSRLADSQTTTPRNTNNSIKGILSSRSKFDSSPTFRMPSSPSSTPTPRPNKLRRSVSTGAISKSSETPRPSYLTRSQSSQSMTPKHRVRFQDEATPECFSPVLLESKGDHSSADSMVGEVTNLTVAVRVRPAFPGERNVVVVEGKTVKVKALGLEHCFSYDYCFNSTGEQAATQQEVFDTMVQPLVEATFQGYNVCLFAYGQTGSGKSYSMMGEEITSSNIVPEKAGIIPRFSQQLFRMIENSDEYSQTKVEISYFEIYNEKIHDLLGPFQNGRSAPLRVREHPELGPYVVDLAVHKIQSFETLQDWLRVGNTHKATAATEMNVNSSRSHSIFTITLTQSQVDDRPSLCSKINLVDLAGSERLAHTCATGDRLKEGVSINRSLLTLGKVISSLAENKKRGFIPYRESVLTWLLRESLGGNSHTAMLATISPSSQFVEETLSTLRYACQARNIINTVRINESPHEKKIRELMEEVQKLKDGVYIKDHTDCEQKLQSLQSELDQTRQELMRANKLCAESEKEIVKLEREWAKTCATSFHQECDKNIEELQKDLSKSENQNSKLEREIRELKRECLETKNKNLEYETEMKKFRHTLDVMNRNNNDDKEEIFRLEKEIDEFKCMNDKLKSEICQLEYELEESKHKNNCYENDLSEMKNNMTEIKKNISHDHCENQILMLQTALAEAERFSQQFKEKIQKLENRCTEMTITSNHEGCEKEISALKETIKELKHSADHGKCDSVIEKLKGSLSGAEKLVSNLQSEVRKLKEEKATLESKKEENQKEIVTLRNTLSEVEKTASHVECEERLNTLKKALSVAKSMNVHVQCENRIAELELEIRNLQSVTLADHSGCDEKINNLFFAVEKYADDNNKIMEKHKGEILRYTATIRSLEEQISKLTAENERKNQFVDNSKDLVHLENQLRLLKDENSKIKKRRLEDENKIPSLEQQVISLTKELLDVKNQLRASLREKVSSESLCSQLQEQLTQQDRKLALTESSRLHCDDDKENWETPSKVIRRSIAQYSKSRKNVRCSLALKAEEIHQCLKDAEDICSRLKIPWVFQLEPEVTTHSWFDVNVRVWDQRTANSVRWPQDVFMGWLRDMKEMILSKSRGHQLFHSATWLQNSKDPEPLPQPPEDTKQAKNLQDEIETLQSRIVALENLCNPRNKQEILSTITTLGRAITQLGSKLGVSSSHLKPSTANLKVC